MNVLRGFVSKIVQAAAVFSALIGGLVLGRFVAEKTKNIPCVSLGAVWNERPSTLQNPYCAGKNTINLPNLPSFESRLPVSNEPASEVDSSLPGRQNSAKLNR